MFLTTVTFLTLLVATYSEPKLQEVSIVKYSNDIIDRDGSYKWSYESSNGIVAEEEGQLKNPELLTARGSYRYFSPEGIEISESYIADENGFQPQGDSIPLPPPIPEAIQRALTWIIAHPSHDQVNDNKADVKPSPPSTFVVPPPPPS